MSKLQQLTAEAARCIQRFTEAVDRFHKATSAKQQEQCVSEMKKDIMKLERMRNQCMQGMGVADSREKAVLLENRRRIEAQLYRFQRIDRATNTNPSANDAPSTAAQKQRSWLCSAIGALQLQIDRIGRDLESLRQAGGKKPHQRQMKEDKKHAQRVQELRTRAERHDWHIEKLEQLLLKLEVGGVRLGNMGGVREDVDYYVDASEEPDFEENEFVYDDVQWLVGEDEEEEVEAAGGECDEASGTVLNVSSEVGEEKDEVGGEEEAVGGVNEAEGCEEKEEVGDDEGAVGGAVLMAPVAPSPQEVQPKKAHSQAAITTNSNSSENGNESTTSTTKKTTPTTTPKTAGPTTAATDVALVPLVMAFSEVVKLSDRPKSPPPPPPPPPPPSANGRKFHYGHKNRVSLVKRTTASAPTATAAAPRTKAAPNAAGPRRNPFATPYRMALNNSFLARKLTPAPFHMATAPKPQFVPSMPSDAVHPPTFNHAPPQPPQTHALAVPMADQAYAPFQMTGLDMAAQSNAPTFAPTAYRPGFNYNQLPGFYYNQPPPGFYYNQPPPGFYYNQPSSSFNAADYNYAGHANPDYAAGSNWMQHTRAAANTSASGYGFASAVPSHADGHSDRPVQMAHQAFGGPVRMEAAPGRANPDYAAGSNWMQHTRAAANTSASGYGFASAVPSHADGHSDRPVQMAHQAFGGPVRMEAAPGRANPDYAAGSNWMQHTRAAANTSASGYGFASAVPSHADGYSDRPVQMAHQAFGGPVRMEAAPGRANPDYAAGSNWMQHTRAAANTSASGYGFASAVPSHADGHSDRPVQMAHQAFGGPVRMEAAPGQMPDESAGYGINRSGFNFAGFNASGFNPAVANFSGLREALASTSPPKKQTHISMLQAVAPLGTVPLTPEQNWQLQMMEAASQHLPEREDSEPLQLQTPANYPQVPLTESFDFYRRLQTETLFHVFQNMKNFRSQHLATVVLQESSWRFHTLLQKWFTRIAEPTVITDTYEQGSFQYFDIDQWCMVDVHSFVFEYKYMIVYQSEAPEMAAGATD